MSAGTGLRCREVVELLSDYLDGTLPERERVRVDEHLAGCDGCSMVLDELRETIRLTGMLTEAQLSGSQRAVLIEGFRGWTSGG